MGAENEPRGPYLTGVYCFTWRGEVHEIRPEVGTSNRGKLRYHVWVDQKVLKTARGALRTFASREKAVAAAKQTLMNG